MFGVFGDIVHTVSAGESLSSIAQGYGLCPRFGAEGLTNQQVRAKCLLAASRLADLNAIANPDLIEPGWELRVAVPEGTAPIAPAVVVDDSSAASTLPTNTEVGAAMAAQKGSGRTLLYIVGAIGLAFFFFAPKKK